MSNSVAGSSALAIDLVGLKKSFGTLCAVDNMNLQIKPGEVVAFLGPNGAGKTTTIDMILGLLPPDEGNVSIFGYSPSQAVARGYLTAVMQSGGLLKELSVVETVRLISTLFAQSLSVEEVLHRAGIDTIANQRVGKCSGGQQQRLRFALALLPRPDLMILDEPTTGMDVEARRDFWKAIHQDSQEGRTIMFATHYLEEADAYADRIVLINKGRVIADASASEIKAMSSGRVVSADVVNPKIADIEKLPGVTSVEYRGNHIVINSTDSDTTARYLLNIANAKNLEITSHNLEDAFIALTTKDS